MAIHVGCGSWTDAVYTGVLYPPGLPAGKRLNAYSQRFEHVEVNSTYYAAPRAKVTAGWVKQTPPGFIFHIKLHRSFSQSPHRATEGEGVNRLLAGVAPLVEAERLGVFLLVLSPSFTPARHRIEELDALASKLQPHALAVELRDRDWVKGKAREQTLAYFRARRLVWVAVDMPRIAASALMPAVDEVTRPDLAYIRLHGRNPGYTRAKTAAERHTYDYTRGDLGQLVKRVKSLADRAEQVHVVANNHAEDFAPKAALELQRLLRSRVSSTAKQ
ncbi:MAG: DUF72 domain-containing protein [Opitutus sp.]